MVVLSYDEGIFFKQVVIVDARLTCVYCYTLR